MSKVFKPTDLRVWYFINEDTRSEYIFNNFVMVCSDDYKPGLEDFSHITHMKEVNINEEFQIKLLKNINKNYSFRIAQSLYEDDWECRYYTNKNFNMVNVRITLDENDLTLSNLNLDDKIECMTFNKNMQFINFYNPNLDSCINKRKIRKINKLRTKIINCFKQSIDILEQQIKDRLPSTQITVNRKIFRIPYSPTLSKQTEPETITNEQLITCPIIQPISVINHPINELTMSPYQLTYQKPINYGYSDIIKPIISSSKFTKCIQNMIPKINNVKQFTLKYPKLINIDLVNMMSSLNPLCLKYRDKDSNVLDVLELLNTERYKNPLYNI